MTGAYTMAMIGGGSLAAALTVPVAAATGSWRFGLGVWALLTLAAMLPVLVLSRRRPADAPSPVGTVTAPRVRPARTSLGWAMALYFGLQALSGYAIMGFLPQIYRDAGFSAQAAGLLLSAAIAAGMPIAMLMPTLAARRSDQRGLVLVMAACMATAYVGLAVAPRAGAVAWTALIAVGQSAFPLALTMIGLRARTAAGTIALSGFTQGAGYLVAAAGPFVVGVIHAATGGWTVPIGFLLAPW